MSRLRTIRGAFEEIKRNDPASAITLYRLRQLVITGEIPSTRAGTKYLIDLDKLEFLSEVGEM